jgi:predicted phosphodiesterase
LAEKLVALTKKTPRTFEDVCNVLDLSPKRLRDLLEECKEKNILVALEGNLVGLPPREENKRAIQIGPKPVIGKRQLVGVLSDTHLGSKYCLREYLKDFVNYAYEEGVREICHVGDICDGMYKHAAFEMSHHGIDDQIDDLFETLPALPGLTYHAITGNHDQTFMDSSGLDVGAHITARFKKFGRHDFYTYGDRGAFLKLRGALIHLWHPRSAGAYAISYPVQKKIESYSPGQKPQVLLCGHWHRYTALYERGIHAFACPTMQGAGSAFSKSLVGSPAIGGLLLEWQLTADGTLRNFKHEFRSYFEEEVPSEIR